MKLMTSEQAREYLQGGEGRAVTRLDNNGWHTMYGITKFITDFHNGELTTASDIHRDFYDDWYACDLSGNPIETATTEVTTETDWKSETCGTCGYFVRGINEPENTGICRRSAFSNTCVMLDPTPACPAYVSKK